MLSVSPGLSKSSVSPGLSKSSVSPVLSKSIMSTSPPGLSTTTISSCVSAIFLILKFTMNASSKSNKLDYLNLSLIMAGSQNRILIKIISAGLYLGLSRNT